MAPALPFITAGLGVMQYMQQGAVGDFNEAVQNRNAQIADQEAKQIEQQNVWDLNQFNQRFNQLQGTAVTKIAKSGVTESGSGLRVLRANAEQAELNKNIMEYNSKVQSGKKLEQANYFRMQGQMAQQQARLAQIGTLFSTGSSLLGMQGGLPKFDGASSMAQWQSNPTGYSGSF
jgi:hypothetical protein